MYKVLSLEIQFYDINGSHEQHIRELNRRAMQLLNQDSLKTYTLVSITEITTPLTHTQRKAVIRTFTFKKNNIKEI